MEGIIDPEIFVSTVSRQEATPSHKRGDLNFFLFSIGIMERGEGKKELDLTEHMCHVGQILHKLILILAPHWT